MKSGRTNERLTALLLFPILKIQITQDFKENSEAMLHQYPQNVLNIQHLQKTIQI